LFCVSLFEWPPISAVPPSWSMPSRGAVSFYEQFGFAPLEVIEGQSHARPAATAMFLPLREIAVAIK
jgi:hypothetical protein